MAQDWELTPAQLDRWTARMTLLFAGKGPLLALAGGDKTLSGYMGEFKLGRPRALRYFLAEPRRLGKLGRLLGVEPSALRSAFEEARASVRPSAGHMLVPGFEDWGWLPTQEVFHESGSGETPRKRRRLRLAGAGRTASSQGIADALPDGGVISIVASPGMGAAALIDAVVERASERHWSVQTGPMLDGDRVIRRLARGEALTPELREWASKDGHAVLRLVDGRWTEGLRGHKARFDMREVDADWCRGFYERVSRLAPRRWRAKLASVEPAEFADEVARWTSPGPVVAGCVLRALAAGTARDGASMCEAMLVRRAEAQGRADLAQLLIGVSGSLPALRCALMSPEGPDVLSETLETEAVR